MSRRGGFHSKNKKTWRVRHREASILRNAKEKSVSAHEQRVSQIEKNVKEPKGVKIHDM